jgi:hypothetical protein
VYFYCLFSNILHGLPANFTQDLQNAITAAIQAAGAPQAQAAGPFALFPATVTINAIDYTTTTSGAKIFKAATETLYHNGQYYSLKSPNNMLLIENLKS